MFDKPSLKELKDKAKLVGLVHAQAYLRKISAADLADYVRNEGIRSDLRKAFAAAAADVGDKKALKAAGLAAYVEAEGVILFGARVDRAPAGVLRAAEQAVQAMLTDEPAVRPGVTINGRPQSMPESDGEPQRRGRMFWECARRLADKPLAQPEAQGHLLATGSGLEQLLPAVTPLFRHEPSMIRWVALRGAITTLHIATHKSPDTLIKLTEAMGLRLTEGQRGGTSVTALRPGQMLGQQLDAALALGTTVYGLLTGYDQVSGMTIQETNAYPAFAALADADGLHCIVWVAVALLRVGRAQEIMQVYPEPDALTEPGWYTEPVFGRFERYWDGTDWTPSVRGKSSQQTVPLR
jgi:hypothetical protein